VTYSLRLARSKGGGHLETSLSDYSRTVVERVAASGQEVVILEDEASGRTPLETGIIRTGARGIVAVPLQKLPMTESLGETFVGAAPELLGLLYLDIRSHAAAVTGLDRQVLQTLAVEGATVIENARMFRLARQQERLQHEMFLARNIQVGLLPRQLPQSDYFQVFAVTTSTEAVGGDYYDMLQLPDGRWGFALADVLRQRPARRHLGRELARCLRRRRRGVSAPGRTFRARSTITSVSGPHRKCSPPSFTVCWTGQEFFELRQRWALSPPLIVRAQGGVEQTDSSNFPLGLFPHVDFQADSGATPARRPDRDHFRRRHGSARCHRGLFSDARLLNLLNPVVANRPRRCAGPS